MIQAEAVFRIQYYASTNPHLAITTLTLGLPDSEPFPSTYVIISIPLTTSPATTQSVASKKKRTGSPKTTCFPSSQLVWAVVMKNWEPLVLGPELAIESRPGLVCLMLKPSSATHHSVCVPTHTAMRTHTWEFFTVYRLAASAIVAGKVPTLEHELGVESQGETARAVDCTHLGNDTVKAALGVALAFGQGCECAEILGGFWNNIVVQLEFNAA
jgi:hypothetical protein